MKTETKEINIDDLEIDKWVRVDGGHFTIQIKLYCRKEKPNSTFDQVGKLWLATIDGENYECHGLTAIKAIKHILVKSKYVIY